MKLKTTLLTLSLSISSVLPMHSAQALDVSSLLKFAGGIFNAGSFPSSDAYITDDEVIVEAYDGVKLAANVFVPTQLKTDELAPAIIFINSWALNEYEYLEQAGELAEKGYVVFSYSTRGWGTSTGLINTGGPKDMSDLSRVVDHVIEHYPVDPQAIGAAGISYGAGIALLGAAHDSRIKAISAMSGWGSLVDALYGDSTPRLVWGEILTLTGDLIGNLDPVVNQHWDDLTNQNLAALPPIIEWGNERSPLHKVDQLNANGTAVYLGKAYGDVLFRPNSILELFSALEGPKFIDLQPGTHATADLLPPLLGLEENNQWDHTYQWFDYHLKGLNNALADAKPVNMKVKFTDTWEQFDDFPISEATTEAFYLHPSSLFDDGDLENYSYRGRSTDDSYHTLLGSIYETGIPLVSDVFSQLIDVPVFTSIPLASGFNSKNYKTDRLRDVMKIRGNPRVSLTIQAHAKQAQIYAYLYDMDEKGVGKLITHGAYTLPNINHKEKVNIDIEMVTTAYNIPSGHRLVIGFDSKDIEYKSITKKGYRMDIEFERKQQNILTIPVL
jgi:predicted acyl esterase